MWYWMRRYLGLRNINNPFHLSSTVWVSYAYRFDSSLYDRLAPSTLNCTNECFYHITCPSPITITFVSTVRYVVLFHATDVTVFEYCTDTYSYSFEHPSTGTYLMYGTVEEGLLLLRKFCIKYGYVLVLVLVGGRTYRYVINPNESRSQSVP